MQVIFYKANDIIQTNQQNLFKLYMSMVMHCRSIFVEYLDEFYWIFERYSFFRKSHFE